MAAVSEQPELPFEWEGMAHESHQAYRRTQPDRLDIVSDALLDALQRALDIRD